jgi:hypothetical protein
METPTFPHGRIVSTPKHRGRPKMAGPTYAELRVMHRKHPDRDTLQILKTGLRLMDERRISRQEFARKSHIGLGILTQYLDPFRNGFGSYPISIIRALAKGCGVSLHDLLRDLKP